MPALLLCSASPRRRALLREVGLSFEVVSPDVDEARLPGEGPRALAERLARSKAEAGLRLWRAQAPGDARVALAADTVVAIGEVDLAKPAGRADTARMLGLLSGREHVVTTGIAVVDAQGAVRSRAVDTTVRFRALSPAQLAWLVDSGDGDDKAGAYAVQGLAGAFIERLDGSVTNVVGLPLPEALDLLEAAGLPLPWSGR